MRRDQLFSFVILTVLALLLAQALTQISPSIPDRLSEAAKTFNEPGEVTGERVAYSVERVVDGDTIIIHGLLDSIRLIGIDTPELTDTRFKVRCQAYEAAKRLQELVGNGEVYLERDVEDRDRYDRFLRYVFLPDGTLVNLTMAKEGYANLLTIPPNVRYAPLFLAAVQEARSAGKGLWNDSLCS